jgi:hypothetical protein
MPTLMVGNGFSTEIPGLGKNQSFSALSEKRMTKAAREALREQYGPERVEVSFLAYFMRGEWVGECKVDQRSHSYRLGESTLL